MHPILWLVEAALIAVLVYACVGTWRLYDGREKARPFIEYVAGALIFGYTGWQAVTWLRTGHSEASDVRYVGVWVQLVTAFAVAALMLLNAWIARAQTARQ